MKETVLITGASSGLGADFARLCAQAGMNCILVARREEKLSTIQKRLESTYSATIHIIAQDLATATAGEELYDQIKSLGLTVNHLINNAGFGGHGLLVEREREKDKSMIQLNVQTLTCLSRLYGEEFVSRGSGKILNVASVAGFIPGPLQAVYFATKAFVVSFSEALINEFSGTGVSVTCLCPGATATEFMKSADLEGTPMTKDMPTSYEVAKFGFHAWMSGKGVVIHGLSNAILIQIASRLLPRSRSARLARRFQEK